MLTRFGLGCTMASLLDQSTRWPLGRIGARLLKSPMIVVETAEAQLWLA